MRTAWTTLEPTSLAHYDKSRRTITIQPWFVNLYWYNFDPRLQPQLFQMLLGISDETEYYSKPSEDLEPLAHRYPKESRVSRASKAWEPTLDMNHEDMESDDEDALPLANNDVNEPLPDEDPNEVREALMATLSALKDTVAATCPALLENARVVALFKQCETDANEFDVSNINKNIDSIRMHLMKALGTGGDHSESNCTFCDEVDVEGQMAWCSNTEHEDPVFMHCLHAGFAHLPDGKHFVQKACFLRNVKLTIADLTSILCPSCQKALEEGSTAGGVKNGDVLPAHKNLVNLGQTCYLSSTLQVLYHIGPVRDIVMDPKKRVFKATELSGRDARGWLPGAYKLTPATPEAEILKMNATHMSVAKQMIIQLHQLFGRMGDTGSKITKKEVQTFFVSGLACRT